MNCLYIKNQRFEWFRENRLMFKEKAAEAAEVPPEREKTPEELAIQGGPEWRQFKRKVRKERRQENWEKWKLGIKASNETVGKSIKERAVKRRMEWLKRWDAETKITTETKSRLQLLHEEMDQKKQNRNLSGQYHTERRDSRDDLEEGKTATLEDIKAARRMIETEGVMSPEEMKHMETAQTVISSHYMNPAFMLYMNTLKEHQPLSSEEVYNCFDVILKNPYAFEYITNKSDDSVVVRKRKGLDFKDIPEVSLKLATKGFVEEVNGEKLTNPKGELPWEGVKYEKRMADYKQRFDYEWAQNVYPQFYAGPYKQNLDEATRNQRYAEMQYEAFDKITPEMRELFALNHIQIPETFLKLVAARGMAFEDSDPGVQALKAAMKQQGKTYREITQERDTKLKVMVLPNPAYPESYMVRFRDDLNQVLVIHKNGYLMKEVAPNNYQIDPRYGIELKQNYYKSEASKGKDAVALTNVFEMKGQMEQAGTPQEEIDTVIGNVQYMRPVEVALSKAKWEDYKQIVIQILSPDDPNTSQTLDAYAAYFINSPAYEEQVKAVISEAVIKRMKKSKEVTQAVAKIVGVNLE